MTYVLAISIFTGILLVLSLPAILTARSHGKTAIMVRFIAAAVGTGLVFGFFDGRYQRAYDLCVAEGRLQCENVGLTGLQLLIVVGFLIASMTMTYRIFND